MAEKWSDPFSIIPSGALDALARRNELVGRNSDSVVRRMGVGTTQQALVRRLGGLACGAIRALRAMRSFSNGGGALLRPTGELGGERYVDVGE